MAKQKAVETAQYAQDRTYDAAQYTKESAFADKDKTGSVLQQAGETVMGAVMAAKNDTRRVKIESKDESSL